ncbi:hypothetical protein R6G99_08470, partial [Actinotignum timonense]|nr:hypothetical protein [Actinotignum timonense]
MVEYQVDAVAEVRASGGMLRAGLRRGVCVSGAAGQARVALKAFEEAISPYRSQDPALFAA